MIDWAKFDYACFASAALILFLLRQYILRRCMERWLIVVDGVFILATVVGAWFLVEKAQRDETAQLRKIIEALAPTYAREMERMQHETIGVQTAADDPHYLALIEAEKRWLATNPGVMDIYTLRKLPDGRNVFIADSETDYDRNGKYEGDREQRTEIGEVYPVQDSGLERAFRGEANFEAVPITDRWGTWVSAWEPLHSSDGKVEAVLGVDYSANEWVRTISHVRFPMLAIVGIVQVIFGGLFGGLALSRAHRKRQNDVLQALRRSEERLSLHLAQTPLAVMEWDREFRVTQWNASAERIFEYSFQEALGCSGFDLIVPEAMRDSMNQTWADLTEHKLPQSSSFDCVTKSGRVIKCESVFTPLVNPDGEVIGVASLFQDTTERKLLEEELQQSQKMQSIGQLAAGIAHDFNNLICVIQGYTDLLVDTPDLPASAKDSAREIERVAKQAADITRQLLTFSRKQRVHRSALDLNNLIERSVHMLEPMIGPAFRIGLRLASPAPWVCADSGLLEQALINLALNARDAMPDGGAIEISSARVVLTAEQTAARGEARPGEFIRISVQDSGTGIVPEHIKHVFEPFFTTKAAGKGTGLGLSTVYGTIKNHQGWIEIQSELGQGTTFHLYLPECAGPVQPSPKTARQDADDESASTPVPGFQYTVLLVDDEEPIRRLTARVLIANGYRVLQAESALEAQTIFSEEPAIDLLFTDVVMPGITGWQLADALLEQRPSLRVVFMSGQSPDKIPSAYAEYPFLQKPFRAAQVSQTVKLCLA